MAFSLEHFPTCQPAGSASKLPGWLLVSGGFLQLFPLLPKHVEKLGLHRSQWGESTQLPIPLDVCSQFYPVSFRSRAQIFVGMHKARRNVFLQDLHAQDISLLFSVLLQKGNCLSSPERHRAAEFYRQYHERSQQWNEWSEYNSTFRVVTIEESLALILDSKYPELWQSQTRSTLFRASVILQQLVYFSCLSLIARFRNYVDDFGPTMLFHQTWNFTCPQIK